MHHAVVAGLRAVRIGRKTYVVLTYVALAVAVSICVCCRVGLVSASTFVPVVILIGLPIGTVCMGMSKSRSDLEAADRALDRIGLSCRLTIGSMSCLAAVDHNTAACDSTDVPVTGLILLPLGALGMTEFFAGCEGFRTLFTALTGLVVLGRISAICLACKVLFLCYFLVEYVGVLELCFNFITTDRTLDRILFGSTTLMIGSMCSEGVLFGTACCVTLVPVTGCILFPRRSVPVVICNGTVGYAANIADCCLLTGSNVGTGRKVFSLGAVNYDTATNNGTLFPVVLSVGRPNAGRSMSTCGNGLTTSDDLTAAKALGIAGVTVGLRLVVFFGLVDKSSAANVSAGNLIAVEGMAVVVFYFTASGAGIVVNSKVTAVAFGLQCFRFLCLSSVVMGCKITVRFATYGAICLCSTGSRSTGVFCEGVLFGTACCVTLMPVTGCILFPRRSVPVVICNSTVGYVANVTNSCLLAGSNVGTG